MGWEPGSLRDDMCIYYAPGYVGLQQVQRSVSEHWCCVHQCHICHLVVFSPSLYGATCSDAMFMIFDSHFFSLSLYGATYSDAMFSIRLFSVRPYMVLRAATPCFYRHVFPPCLLSFFCSWYFALRLLRCIIHLFIYIFSFFVALINIYHFWFLVLHHSI